MTLQRTEPFVPLTAAIPSSENREFRVTVIPQNGTTQPFQTLEQVASSAAENGSLNGKKNCEPRLSLQRDGERVTNIRIQCNCGQMLDLACVYDEPPKTP
jgi:hypothetical protein